MTYKLLLICLSEYDVNFTNYFPNAIAVPDPFIVGSGVETTINVEGVTDLVVDFSDTSLLITLITVLPLLMDDPDPTWGSATQNGPAFTVLSGNPFPAIGSVTSTIGPVSAFFSGGTLFINWADRQYHTGDTVTVSFETPLPAALPLFASGLGILAWWRRRKNSSVY